MNHTFAGYLKDRGTFATSLLVGLIDEFGTELFEWDPDTLRLELKSEYQVDIPQSNMDKIQALLVVMTTDLFYRNLEAFMHVANSLGHSGADFQSYDPPDVQEISWALAETALVDPPDKNTAFGPEIVTYMREKLRDEGFSKAPRIMAPFCGNPDRDEDVSGAFADDEVLYHGYWESQQRKALTVDRFLQEGLQRIMSEISALPLQSANKQAIRELKQRVDKAAAKQRQATDKESESVSPVPLL